jgi:hypothetical protein
LILGGIFAVVLGICVVAAVLQITQSSTVKANLGPDTFVIGNAKGFAKLADQGGPFLFRDPTGGTRDLYVIHVKDGHWAAVVASLPDEPSCRIELERATKVLVDCHGIRYRGDPPTLQHVKVYVDAKDRLVVEPGKAPDAA